MNIWVNFLSFKDGIFSKRQKISHKINLINTSMSAMNNLLFTSHKVRETRSFPKKYAYMANKWEDIILLCFPHLCDNKGDRKFKYISKDIYVAILPSTLNLILLCCLTYSLSYSTDLMAFSFCFNLKVKTLIHLDCI